MTTPVPFDPLEDWFLRELENLEAQPKVTWNDISGRLNTIFYHFLPAALPHGWMTAPFYSVYQAATPETENRITDQFQREVDADIVADHPQFIIAKCSGRIFNDIARLVVSVIGTAKGREEKALERLQTWTKKLYEGISDANGAGVLQGLLVVGMFAQVFDITNEGDVVKLVPASEKMSLRSPEFQNFLHNIANEGGYPPL